MRLALGYVAVIIAGALFYADWKLGWDVTKPYTLPACVAYFVLNGALTYWVWAVEAGIVFVGTREGGQKVRFRSDDSSGARTKELTHVSQLTLKSSVKKHDPTYRLKVRYEAPSGKKWEDKEITGKFTEWFNTYGYLQKKEFQSWLSKNIEVVGLADPETVKGGEKKYEEVLNNTITVASGAETPSSAGQASPAKRGRPPKKKA